MRNLIDFSSWQGVLSTLLGLVIVTFVAVGIRLLVMQRVQQRRERQNRQVNERLKTLIAAYKTLGGSFTGNLSVDPGHLRDQRLRAAAAQGGLEASPTGGHSERQRRIRDAVEAALSDVILLGTAEQVRLAAQAASDMVAGRRVETAALVQSLRDFIREVLDLDAVPVDVPIPKQGPLRTAATGGRGGAGAGGRDGGGAGRGAGGGGTGGGLGGAGIAAGGMAAVGVAHAPDAAEASDAADAADATDAMPQSDARQP